MVVNVSQQIPQHLAASLHFVHLTLRMDILLRFTPVYMYIGYDMHWCLEVLRL